MSVGLGLEEDSVAGSRRGNEDTGGGSTKLPRLPLLSDGHWIEEVDGGRCQSSPAELVGDDRADQGSTAPRRPNYLPERAPVSGETFSTMSPLTPNGMAVRGVVGTLNDVMGTTRTN